MRYPGSRRAAALAAAMLALAGCSTPEARIRKHPALFASLPPEAQANIRLGRIAIGYTPDMVRLALGEPDQVFVRVTAAEGETEHWAYFGGRYVSDLRPAETAGWHRGRDGRLRPATDVRWVDVGGFRQYERLRVEFAQGKVSAIERLSE